MKKIKIIAAIRAAKAAPGHEQRVDDWRIWVTRIYRRGCPGPAWTPYIYAQRDGERYEIGGWTNQCDAADSILRYAARPSPAYQLTDAIQPGQELTP